MVTVRNKSDTLYEISERHTPNDKYENFVTAHTEAAAECKPTKCRFPWKLLVVRKKQDTKKSIFT